VRHLHGHWQVCPLCGDELVAALGVLAHQLFRQFIANKAYLKTSKAATKIKKPSNTFRKASSLSL
jgi:hypothetical protein